MAGELENQQSQLDSSLKEAQRKLGEGITVEGKEDHLRYRQQFIASVDEFQALASDPALNILALPEAQKYYQQGVSKAEEIMLNAVKQGIILSQQEKGTAQRESAADTLNALGAGLSKYMREYMATLPEIAAEEQKFKELDDIVSYAKKPFANEIISANILGNDYFSKVRAGIGLCGEFRDILASSGKLPSDLKAMRTKNRNESFEYLTKILQIEATRSTIISSGYDQYIEFTYNISSGKQTLSYNEKFRSLPLVEQMKIQLNIGRAQLQVANEAEILSTPKPMSNYLVGMALFEQGRFSEAKEALTVFLEKDINNPILDQYPDFFKNRSKQEYEKSARSILEKIAEQDSSSADFREAQKRLNVGELAVAKKLLQKFLQEHGNDKYEKGKFNFVEAANGLLVNIAKVQFEELKEKLLQEKIRLKIPDNPPPKKIMQVSPRGGMAGGSAQYVDNIAYYSYMRFVDMAKRVDGLGERVKAGQINDLAGEISKVFNLEELKRMDPLNEVVVENEGREGYLKLAMEYRERGEYDKARQYYRKYFGDLFRDSAEKTVTLESLRTKYNSNPTFQAGIAEKEIEVKNEYKQRFGTQKTPSGKPLWLVEYEKLGGEGKIRHEIENRALQEIWPQEIMMAKQQAPDNIPAAELPAWNEFAKMEGVKPREIAGIETVAISSERLRQLIIEISIQVVITALSAGIASVAAAAASRGIVALAGRIGASHFTTVLASGAVGFAVESSVFTLSTSVAAAIREGQFNVGAIGGHFQKEILSGTMMLGAFKMAGLMGRAFSTGSTIAERSAANVAWKGFNAKNFQEILTTCAAKTANGTASIAEESLMMAIFGGHELTADDIAMVMGMKLAHSKTMEKATGKLQRGKENDLERIKARNRTSRPEIVTQFSRGLVETRLPGGTEIKYSPETVQYQKAAEEARRRAVESGDPSDLRLSEAYERAALSREMRDKIIALDAALNNKDLTPELRERLEASLRELTTTERLNRDLERSSSAFRNEENWVNLPDPGNPGEMIRVNLLEGMRSKNFAYTKEMVDLMNDHARLLKEGPVIVKHGGDEILIVHAGANGKVQMFYGDIGNMGPTNEFALKIKGGNANLVDLYLREFNQLLRQSFKPGADVNGPELLARIKKNLSQKFFGIENEAQFKALQEQYGIDGTWAQYENNMHSARVLAGFRGSSRQLQKEFLEQHGNGAGNLEADSAAFAEFVGKKIKALESGTPPLTDFLRNNFDAVLQSGALDQLLPRGTEFQGNVLTPERLKDIISKPAERQTAEEKLIVFYALKRVQGAKLPPGNYDLAAMRGRFERNFQDNNEYLLMDFQMSGIEIPNIRGRQFDSSDMKFFLDKVLEDGLHEAKKNKDRQEIQWVKNPYDQNGTLRTGLDPSYARKHAEAKADTKSETAKNFEGKMRQARELLDRIINETTRLSNSEKVTAEELQALAKLKNEYQKLKQDIDSVRFKDAETGADRPVKFSQDIEDWAVDRNENKIARENRIVREFIFDLNNTGAINANGGYQLTDNIMSAIHGYLVSKVPGISSVIRSGGGQFRVIFMDQAALPVVEGKAISSEAQMKAIQDVMPELNRKIQELLAADRATNVDGIVRNSTNNFSNKETIGNEVGEVRVKLGIDVSHANLEAWAGRTRPPLTLDTIRRMQGEIDQAELQLIAKMKADFLEVYGVIGEIEKGNFRSERVINAIIESGAYLAASLLKIKDLQFTPAQQARLVDMIFASTGKPKEPGPETRKEAAEEVMSYVESGQIALPSVIDRLLTYQHGRDALIVKLALGSITDPVMVEKIVREGVKNNDILKALETRSFAEPVKSIVERLVKEQRIRVTDGEFVQDQALRNPVNFQESMRRHIAEGLKDTSDPTCEMLIRLRDRDPVGYQILTKNFGKLTFDYMKAIVEGRGIEGTSRGRRIRAFRDGEIGQGGMGHVAHTAYVEEGSTEIKFAVIKMAYDHTRETFKGDVKGAEITHEWDHPNINKALEVTDSFIIFETGTNVRPLNEEVKSASAVDTIRMLRQVIAGIAKYQQEGYIHGDIKPQNIIVIDTPQGRQVQLIDNTPVKASKSDPRIGQGLYMVTHSPFYTNEKLLPDVLNNPEAYFRAIDTYSLAVMMAEMKRAEFGPEFENLYDRAADPDFADRPSFLSELDGELAIIEQRLTPHASTVSAPSSTISPLNN